ncbi:MAG TPA: lamin tail domain-containing protein [Pyrinomonadaceae bacterium]
MKSKLASVFSSRRFYLLLFFVAALAFRIGTPVQSQTSTTQAAIDPKPYICPDLGMCIMDPEGGGCMGTPCPYPLPTNCGINVAAAARGATATASSVYVNGNYSPSGAINGDRRGLNWGNGGGWNDNTRDIYPDWLQVDFNGVQVINQIRLYTLQNDYTNPFEPTPAMTAEYYGLLDFEVQAWVGAQWVTVPGGSVVENQNVMRVFSFPYITTPKIRILVTNARNHFSRIVEVEAFSCANAPVPDPTPVCLPLESIDPCEIATGRACLAESKPCISPEPVPSPGQPNAPLIISEFRFRGPGGANDEFIELFNTAPYPVNVSTADGSAGWSVVGSDGAVRFTIPVGTVIPGNGHYLAVNSLGYTLGNYPAGNGTTAAGDTAYILDIPDGGGIALFKTSEPLNFTTPNRLDAAGYNTAPPLYREGAGFPVGAAESLYNIEYSFFRDLTSGSPRDTNDNIVDFKGADTNGNNTGAGQRLGAPGPENLSSPIPTGSSKIRVDLLDPAVTSDQPPNRVRDATSDPGNNSAYGTMSIRRTLVNVSSQPITRLRVRIIDITGYPYISGTSDIRAISSTDLLVARTDGSVVMVNGTTLETPPAQINGGGWNSTLSANDINLSSPLYPGQGYSLQFMLGVQQSGSFRFFIIIEALP